MNVLKIYLSEELTSYLFWASLLTRWKRQEVEKYVKEDLELLYSTYTPIIREAYDNEFGEFWKTIKFEKSQRKLFSCGSGPIPSINGFYLPDEFPYHPRIIEILGDEVIQSIQADMKSIVEKTAKYFFSLGGLNDITTLENLRDKRPEIFAFYVEEALKAYDSVEIVEVEDEIDELVKFLGLC